MIQSDFISSLLPLVQERLPEGLEVSLREIEKNNGVIHTGLCLCPGEGTGSSAILYPEQFSDALETGSSLEEIAAEVARALLMPIPEEIRRAKVTDPEFILENVILKLVGRAGNRELKKKVVNRVWLDMLEIPALLIDGENMGSGIVLLTKEMLRKSGLTEEEVFTCALENTREKLGETVRSVEQVLAQDLPEETEASPGEKLYVMSNLKYCLGAATLLYPEKLKKLAETLQTDIYVLPSSIHEVILVPDMDVSETFLKSIISEANQTECSPEEILTDSLYLYRREKEEIILV